MRIRNDLHRGFARQNPLCLNSHFFQQDRRMDTGVLISVDNQNAQRFQLLRLRNVRRSFHPIKRQLDDKRRPFVFFTEDLNGSA